jgi:N-acetylglucosaminyldiphosphoundecaprenol N-acetyl-beta-D-mannosaminyltransferase
MPRTLSRFKFLGLYFDNLSLSESVARVVGFIASGKPHAVFTLNAEAIVRAQFDPWLRGVYHAADLVTVDSYVVGYGVRVCGRAFKEPVSAARLMFKLLPVANDRSFRVFLLGATDDVVKAVGDQIRQTYPEIVIAGSQNGYFDFDHDEKVVAGIRASNADLLFVAMSTPLKERFINKNLAAMNVPVCLGVGGAFDIVAGKTKHAPKWISQLGLEWFFRFVQEPRRLWRRYLTTNSLFLLLLAKEWLRKSTREDPQ